MSLKIKAWIYLQYDVFGLLEHGSLRCSGLSGDHLLLVDLALARVFFADVATKGLGFGEDSSAILTSHQTGEDMCRFLDLFSYFFQWARLLLGVAGGRSLTRSDVIMVIVVIVGVLFTWCVFLLYELFIFRDHNLDRPLFSQYHILFG